MKHDIIEIVDEFKIIIDSLINFYKTTKQKDYFFTEKEIHSYFYHLCLDSTKFITNNGFNLIHTEYPTPFKCSKLNTSPYIELAENDSKNVRSHIDMVLINPNFVDWILDNNKDIMFINGIGNGKFSDYIKKFGNQYELFQYKYKEPILLFAIEFKYYRHTFSGNKSAQDEIKYDIEKLNLLKNITINTKEINYCPNVLSLVFIGHRISKFKNIIEDNGSDECKFIERN